MASDVTKVNNYFGFEHN
uniref:Uncharacterized protein n=1 Tax=Arundo donax TaxID=35708 RepID=A0A0A9HQD6_ARUDO